MAATKRTPKVKRRRRTPDVVRAAALKAARNLLLRLGPESVTLPAIAKELDMTHGNITHHFGSVGSLHASLVDQMADELTRNVNNAVTQLRTGETDPVKVVDALFDALLEERRRSIDFVAGVHRKAGSARAVVQDGGDDRSRVVARRAVAR